jgi:hypothetical protein
MPAADVPAAIPDLAPLLGDAVESGASVRVLSGLDVPRAVAWWQDRALDVESGALGWSARRPRTSRAPRQRLAP